MTPAFFVLASAYLSVGAGVWVAFGMNTEVSFSLDRLIVVILWPYLLLTHVGVLIGKMIVKDITKDLDGE